MPARSKKQWRWMWATGQPFARRWANETPAFSALPATKAEATDADAEAPAPKSRYAGNTPEARRERARHAALVRYGKENPMQARLAKIRTARKAKAKKGGGGKGKAAPKPTVDKAAEEAANLNKVGEALLDADSPLSKKGLESLASFAAGGSLSPEQAKSLAALGVVTLGADGTPRMSADGKALIAAAKRGDVRAALDAASAAGERVGVGAAGEAVPKDAKPKEEKPKKGGGGSGGKGPKEKPDATEKDAERAKARALVRDSTAGAVGLAKGDGEALRRAADGEGGAPSASLVKLGLVGKDGLTTDAGRRALSALERGDKAGYQAALQDVRAATQRDAERTRVKGEADAARAKRERERADAEAGRKKEKAAAEAQELDDLADDYRAKRKGLSMKDQRRLVRAGRATFGKDGAFTLSATKTVSGWRWAVKAEDDANTPPEAVQAAARRALERRGKAPPSQRGMTPVGLARARDLSNGRPVSVATARRMVNYFTRHQKDKQGETWGDYGPGRQAWDGWGGDAGWRWARGVVARADGESATKVINGWRWAAKETR